MSLSVKSFKRLLDGTENSQIVKLIIRRAHHSGTMEACLYGDCNASRFSA